MTAFWRTFHHDGKICPGWWGGGCTTSFRYIYHHACTKLQCTLRLRGQINSPISSLSLWTLWSILHLYTPSSPPLLYYTFQLSTSRIHERKIVLRFPGIILRVQKYRWLWIARRKNSLEFCPSYVQEFGLTSLLCTLGFLTSFSVSRNDYSKEEKFLRLLSKLCPRIQPHVSTVHTR